MDSQFVRLKSQVMAWLSYLERDREAGPAYPVSASASDKTLMASCFAVLIYELFGELSSLPRLRLQGWQNHIASFQDRDTGLFLDPLFRAEDLIIDGFDRSYLEHQSTFFALSALSALGGRALYPLHFLEAYRSPQRIRSWLAALGWSRPWAESNKIMFVASFLIQASEIWNDRAAAEAVQALFDWLDEQQEPETGYWGVRHGASLLNAMAGAFHFYFLYLYQGRPFRYLEAIIDHTLSLQHPDGLFHPAGGGGACLDLDAVDILVKCSLLTDYRAVDIKAGLARAYAGLLDAQNEDGGFSEARNWPRPVKSWKHRLGEAVGLDWLLGRPYQPPTEIQYYSGWSRMQYGLRESNLWATWFRPLAVALISTRYPGAFTDSDSWVFHRRPALGWHDPEAVRRCGSVTVGDQR